MLMAALLDHYSMETTWPPTLVKCVAERLKISLSMSQSGVTPTQRRQLRTPTSCSIAKDEICGVDL